MKHTRFSLLILPLTMLLYTTSCNQPQALVENKITFDSLQVNETYHLLNNEKNPACTVAIKYIYPVAYADTVVLQAVQEIMQKAFFDTSATAASPELAANAHIQKHIEEYKKLEPDYKKKRPAAKTGITPFLYTANLSNTIYFNKGYVLTVIDTATFYSGGAHGLSLVKVLVIDLYTGKQLVEDDVFKANTHEQLAGIIVKQLLSKHAAEGVLTPEDLLKVGYSDIAAMAPNGNFKVDEKGITYIYNQYEIAPYSSGIIEIYLPYDLLKDLLKKDGVVTKLAGL